LALSALEAGDHVQVACATAIKSPAAEMTAGEALAAVGGDRPDDAALAGSGVAVNAGRQLAEQHHLFVCRLHREGACTVQRSP
jgi:hypothetical protein